MSDEDKKQPGATDDKSGTNDTDTVTISKEELEKIKQSASDSRYNKYLQEKADLEKRAKEAEDRLKSIETEKMTAEEKAALKEKEWREQQEATLRSLQEESAKNRRLEALREARGLVKDPELDPLVEILVTADQEITKGNLEKLTTVIDKIKQKAVDDWQKSQGRNPDYSPTPSPVDENGLSDEEYVRRREAEKSKK